MAAKGAVRPSSATGGSASAGASPRTSSPARRTAASFSNSTTAPAAAATIAGAHCSAELPKVGASAIQVFGGIGFTWEHDIHLFYKRLLSASTRVTDADSYLAELATIAIDA